MRESVIADELADWAPVLRQQLLGGAGAHALEAELERLGAVRCFFFEGSVGALFGVELGDGTRLAVKLHQEHARVDDLLAVQRVQAQLAANDFPCPAPLLEPTPFLGRLATGEAWRDEGEHAAPGDARRAVFAALLARQIDLCASLHVPALRTRIPNEERLWPRPHNALFDFDATGAGAEWIDEIAREAKERHRGGPVVIAHQDWTFKHIRWNGNEPAVVYDWDSVSQDNESIAVGAAAAMHTYPSGYVNGWTSSVDDAGAFLDAYEAVRPLGAARRAAEAHAVYAIAYTSRCEHALDLSRDFDPVTHARGVLREFAERLL